MTNFINQFEPFIRDCLWQSTLCLLVGLGGSLCWAKRPARSHRVLLLALGAALVAPLLSLAVRHYDWGMLPPSASVARANSEKPTQSAPTVSLTRSATVQSPDVPEKAIGSVALAEASAGEKLPVPWAVADNALPQFRWKAIALSVWAALSGLAGLRLALSILRGLALIKRAEPDADLCIQNAANLAASKLGIAAAPEVRVSKEVGCPVIWCWHKRPLLVIPAAALPSRGTLDWEGLFCHELAHWKRRDHLAELFAEIAAMILPWQPLVWWSRTRLSHLADAVCDEWALHCGRQGPAYANSLLELLPQIRSVGAIPAVRNRRKLERRIRRILSHESPQPLAGRWWSRCVGVGMAVAMGLLAFLQIQTRSKASVADQARDKEEAKIQAQTQQNQASPTASASTRRLVTGDGLVFLEDEDNLALSPDGRYLARVNLNSSELILVDTTTGAQRRIAERCDWGAVWSADGKRIAYGSRPDGVPFDWAVTATNRVVRVVDITSGESEVLLEGDFWIEDWASESQVLLGYRSTNSRGPNALFVDLRSGKRIDFTGNSIVRAYPRRLSPDGTLIAYCVAEQNQTDLYIHQIASSNRVVLADFPGSKSDPLWSPDGKHLVFRCSQPGATHTHVDLWCVRVENGKFVGTPFPVMGGVRDMKFYNWARNGQLAYSVSFRPRNGLYLLEIDPENARAKGTIRHLVRSEARRLYRNEGMSVHTWSPDSNEIAFVLDYELLFVSAATGETLRRLPLAKLKKFDAGFGIDWSPDGRTIAIPGTDDQGRRGLHGIHVATGEQRLLFKVATNAMVYSSRWLPDGKSIAFDGSLPRRIYAVDIEKGIANPLTTPEMEGTRPHTLAALAPDGKSIFYNSRERRTFSVGIDTKEAREFLPQVNAAGLRLAGFSFLPGSRFVVFQARRKIWATAVPDGQPFEIASLPAELADYTMSNPKCSPDGKTITFAVDSDKVEYWVMENFLPPEKVAAK